MKSSLLKFAIALRDDCRGSLAFHLRAGPNLRSGSWAERQSGAVPAKTRPLFHPRRSGNQTSTVPDQKYD